MKEVIIKVYVETPQVFPPQQRTKAIKRTIPLPSSSSKLQNARTRGYDRRADLLAYAQKLRHGNAPPSGKRQSSKSHSLKYKKKWKWSSLSFPQIRLSSFPRLFHRSNRQWRYELINTEDYNCVHESLRGKKMKRKSSFCEKFKCFIKELSCGYQCSG